MSTLLRRTGRAALRTAIVPLLSTIAAGGAATLVFGAYAILVRESVLGIFAVPFGISLCAFALNEIRQRK